MGQMRNRVIFTILICGIVAAMSFLVIISPLALRAVASNSSVNWPELSNIGQTYGAVSALLSALALAGVAASILMQNRELRHSRWEAGRSRHFDIMRMALDDPFYRQIFSMPDTSESEARIVGYTNMLLQYWAMLWEFGDWSEAQLRACLSDVLSTEAGRSYWRKYSSGRSRLARTRRERAFQRIADEIYLDIGQPGQDEIKVSNSHARRLNPVNAIQGAGFILGVIAACVALLSWKTKLRDKKPG